MREAERIDFSRQAQYGKRRVGDNLLILSDIDFTTDGVKFNLTKTQVEPINSFMIFRAPQRLGITESEALKGVEEIRTQLGYALRTPARWYGVLRRATFARGIRGSNSIEGILVTQEDAVAAIENEEPVDANVETWRAIRGYRDAMTYVLQLANDPHFRFSEALIRSLHFMITQYNLNKHPGLWRPGSIYVRDEARNVTVYEGPPADLVPHLMDELVEYLNADSGEHPLIRAAMAHLNLAKIHPFSDGNGRMARCLHTLVLSREGILDPMFSSIEEYLGRNTPDYYHVLEQVGKRTWDPSASTDPWISFVIIAHYRQAETLLRRTREIRVVWDSLEDLIKRRGLPDRAIFALSDAAFGYRVRNATYRAAAEIDLPTASRDLKQITLAGLLEAVGEGRGRHYQATQVVKDIRERAREEKRRPVPDALAQLELFTST